MSFKTADLCDKYCGNNCEDIQVAGATLKHYGGINSFHGEIVTVKIFEDNQLVRDQVYSDGKGKVLIVDGGASMRRAVLGDMLAASAAENGWNGIIINGCIRDAEDMAYVKLGVMALGTHPLKTVKAGIGKTNVSVSFTGLNFEPADFIYVDIDGIVIAEKPLV